MDVSFSDLGVYRVGQARSMGLLGIVCLGLEESRGVLSVEGSRVHPALLLFLLLLLLLLLLRAVEWGNAGSAFGDEYRWLG